MMEVMLLLVILKEKKFTMMPMELLIREIIREILLVLQPLFQSGE